MVYHDATKIRVTLNPEETTSFEISLEIPHLTSDTRMEAHLNIKTASKLDRKPGDQAAEQPASRSFLTYRATYQTGTLLTAGHRCQYDFIWLVYAIGVSIKVGTFCRVSVSCEHLFSPVRLDVRLGVDKGRTEQDDLIPSALSDHHDEARELFLVEPKM